MAKVKDAAGSAGKDNISSALELLRSELKLLQEQDVLLLQQLMNIHFTLRTIRRGNGCRRTSSLASFRAGSRQYSSAGNTSLLVPPPPPSNGLTTPPTSKRPCRAVLSRVHSEPGGFNSLLYEASPLTSMEEEREIEHDFLTNSCNSIGSDLDYDPPPIDSYLKLSLDLSDGTSELLDDMPLSLRRKYVTSLTSHTLPRAPSNPGVSSNSRSSRGRFLPRQNALQKSSRASSLDSDHGIEITAAL